MMSVVVILLAGLGHGGAEKNNVGQVTAVPYLDELASHINKKCDVTVLNRFPQRHSHHTINQQAQAVVAEVERQVNNDYSLIFVGHSMGGLVGAEAAKIASKTYKVLGIIGLDTAFQGANIINNAGKIKGWAESLDEKKNPALDSVLNFWPSVTNLALKVGRKNKERVAAELVGAKEIKIVDELQGPLGIMFEPDKGLDSDNPTHAPGVADMLPGSDFLQGLFANCGDWSFGAIRGHRTSLEDSWLSHMKDSLKYLKAIVPVSGVLNRIAHSFSTPASVIGIDKEKISVLNSFLQEVKPSVMNEKMRKEFIGCQDGERSDSTLSEREQGLPVRVKCIDSTWTQSNPSYDHVHICSSSDPFIQKEMKLNEQTVVDHESKTVYGNGEAIAKLCKWIKMLKVVQ